MSPSCKLHARFINAWLTLYQLLLILWKYQVILFPHPGFVWNLGSHTRVSNIKENSTKARNAIKKKKKWGNTSFRIQEKSGYLVCEYNSQFITCKWKCLHYYRFSSCKLIIGARIMSFLYRSLISFRLLPFHSLSRRGQSDYMIQKQSPLPPESKFFFFFFSKLQWFEWSFSFNGV